MATIYDQQSEQYDKDSAFRDIFTDSQDNYLKEATNAGQDTEGEAAGGLQAAVHVDPAPPVELVKPRRVLAGGGRGSVSRSGDYGTACPGGM